MPRARIFTIQEVLEYADQRSGAVVKFVQVKDDGYRFQFPENYMVRHSDMLDEGEEVVSAGFFTLFPNGDGWIVKLRNEPSTSLKISPIAEDQQNLERLFGLLSRA
jgi:hypothetical protein